MPHTSRKRQLSASEQLHQLLGEPWPFPGRPPKHDLSTWTVTDDRPERISVTDAEVDVFEATGPIRCGDRPFLQPLLPRSFRA